MAALEFYHRTEAPPAAQITQHADTIREKIKHVVVLICGFVGTMVRKWACLKELD